MKKFLHYDEQGIAVDRISRYEKVYSRSIRFYMVHETTYVEVEFNTERGRNREWNKLEKLSGDSKSKKQE